ncbi:endonuclease domain-containing protein [Demequina zhanjiangensis]|uniref:DUF559 domain-containing protein n=1 Tax=Demequina zhanjiangensis TaxID=3051659 RepID=A0ABT8G2Q7_9MICO|nr:DUF559 domain-containing protein [Demequina sp. SYSU T00b26]MDN4473415.1 DUF559 domain-containing protein [Demequina sp. SYSU T00b26]
MPETVRVRGFTVLDAADAIVAGYGSLEIGERAETFYRAVRSRIVSPESLADALERTPRVRNRRELMLRIAAAGAGVESYLEEHGLRRVFTEREFPQLHRQHRVRVGAAVYRTDMFDRATRTAVELDGAQFHGSARARMRDQQRDEALASIGVLTLRFSYRDIIDRPEWCKDTLRRVLEDRQPTPRDASEEADLA